MEWGSVANVFKQSKAASELAALIGNFVLDKSSQIALRIARRQETPNAKSKISAKNFTFD